MFLFLFVRYETFTIEFCKRDLPDHLLYSRISRNLSANNFALEGDDKYVEFSLKKDTTILGKDTTPFIHLDIVETKTRLWGLFMLDKSCVFFFLSPFLRSIRNAFKVGLSQRSLFLLKAH